LWRLRPPASESRSGPSAGHGDEGQVPQGTRCARSMVSLPGWLVRGSAVPGKGRAPPLLSACMEIHTAAPQSVKMSDLCRGAEHSALDKDRDARGRMLRVQLHKKGLPAGFPVPQLASSGDPAGPRDGPAMQPGWKPQTCTDLGRHVLRKPVCESASGPPCVVPSTQGEQQLHALDICIVGGNGAIL
jgi:hypothetical protein